MLKLPENTLVLCYSHKVSALGLYDEVFFVSDGRRWRLITQDSTGQDSDCSHAALVAGVQDRCAARLEKDADTAAT